MNEHAACLAIDHFIEKKDFAGDCGYHRQYAVDIRLMISNLFQVQRDFPLG